MNQLLMCKYSPTSCPILRIRLGTASKTRVVNTQLHFVADGRVYNKMNFIISHTLLIVLYIIHYISILYFILSINVFVFRIIFGTDILIIFHCEYLRTNKFHMSNAMCYVKGRNVQ